VPPRDVDKLTESLLTLIEDKSLREQMGASGKQRAQIYDWSHIAQRILDFYQETLDKMAAAKTPTRPSHAGAATGK